MYRNVILLAILATLCVQKVAAAAPTSEQLEQILPAYALALRGGLLNSSLCHEELETFKTAVDHRKLWALKSK